MLGSKVIAMFFIFASMFTEIGSKKLNKLSTKEFIKFYVREIICQWKTCKRCTKLIKMRPKNKITKVKNRSTTTPILKSRGDESSIAFCL